MRFCLVEVLYNVLDEVIFENDSQRIFFFPLNVECLFELIHFIKNWVMLRNSIKRVILTGHWKLLYPFWEYCSIYLVFKDDPFWKRLGIQLLQDASQRELHPGAFWRNSLSKNVPRPLDPHWFGQGQKWFPRTIRFYFIFYNLLAYFLVTLGLCCCAPAF